MELALAVATARVRREPWWYLWAALLGSRLGAWSRRQIRFSFMSERRQKRKTQLAGGMTPPLSLGNAAQFQKIRRVGASESCGGVVARALGVEPCLCPFAAKHHASTRASEM